MKTTLLLLIFAFNAFAANAEATIGQNRKLTVPTTLQEAVLNGGITLAAIPGVRAEMPLSPQSFCAGTKFTIINQTGDSWIIDIWNYKDSTKFELYNKNVKENRQKYFKINKTETELISVEIFKQWSPVAGAFTFPFKYRPQDKLFEPTFSLSATAGVRFDPTRTKDFTIAFLLGIGASSADVTTKNSSIAADAQLSSVTTSFNLVFDWRSVQLGLSYGIDNLLSGNDNGWRYQGKPWYSIGIGIAIFSDNKIKQPGMN